MNQMGGAAACLACMICAFLTIGLFAPLMAVNKVEALGTTTKTFSGVYYGYYTISVDGVSSNEASSITHNDNCDSDYNNGESWACWFEWTYILSLFFAVVSLCSTIGGAANAHPQALAGAAGVNFCTGLWCMICASIFTGNMGGAPAGANFSYAALWLCWLLSWIVAGICGAAHSQGAAGDGMATGPKEEVVVVTAV